MAEYKSIALAHSNIAFIKYWGNQDDTLRLPANNSISMNLEALRTITEVELDDKLTQDVFVLNKKEQKSTTLERVRKFMDVVRKSSPNKSYARITSQNNFPASAGLASSASGFAALTMAAVDAYGLNSEFKEISILARKGSGSAARSIPTGFVEWYASDSDKSSFATSIAPPEHWDLVDVIAIVEEGPKPTGSTMGHKFASTSPLQTARVKDCPRRLEICRQAIMQKNFSMLAEVIEQDSNMLHAVMMTSNPRLIYWNGTSLCIMKAVTNWRKQGLAAAYTLDAGANVHVICESKQKAEIQKRISSINGVQRTITSSVGDGARLLSSIEFNTLQIK